MKPSVPIAITLGDPAGVGPELCLRLLNHDSLHTETQRVPLVLGSRALLERVARTLHIPFRATVVSAPPKDLRAPTVYDLPNLLDAEALVPRVNSAAGGAAAAQCIEEAIRGCMAGDYAAMVTAPISKKALHLAGVHYPGHTELLADRTRAPFVAMLLYSEEIACVFATCHQSLASVPGSLTVERVIDVTRLGHAAVKRLRGTEPRLCLLGLNPHAGEEGLFGDEEERILMPALTQLRAEGLQIDGPLPPDTAFTPAMRKKYGCYVAMYHDQGGIPFKMLAFDTGVNITLNLPIVRTSPDHGTAFDIAWRGTCDPSSFFHAYRWAARLAP